MADEGEKPKRAARWLFWGFAAVGALAALAVIGLAVLVLGFALHNPPGQPATVAGAGAPGQSEAYSVQSVDEVRGTDLLQIAIGVGDSRSEPYSSRGPNDQRNLILLNRSTGDSRRLLQDNSRHIDAVSFFPAVAEGTAEETNPNDVAPRDDEAKKTPPPAFAYYALTVRQKEGLQRDLLVGDLASGKQGFVLSGIDGIDRMWMLSPTRLAVLLREKLKLHYRVIDLPSLKMVTARPIDIG